ncbi:MAG: Efflux transporter, RND family, MFP subunit [Candidatus Magasanikbacteria bacterium GW2011_GWA2_43_9]|nr:MAG: Efflux transporter, RND family, MFP subunit [Candidatus Magasanikbacteria bacterium GW2011_GWA2_43_9]
MKFFKKKWVLITLAVVVLLGGIVFATSRKEPVPEFSSQAVERRDLSQIVSETGSVEASLELTYGWEMSGKVVEILKTVGDTVTSTDVIARIANAQQRARYNEAAAALSSAQARLNLELAGPSDEGKLKAEAAVAQEEAALVQAEANVSKVEAQTSATISTAEKAVDTAKNNLQFVVDGEESDLVNDAYADLVNTLKSAVTNLGNALTEADNILGLDNEFANDDFEDVLGVVDSSTLNQAKNSYYQAKSSLSAAQAGVVSLSTLSPHDAVDATHMTVAEAISRMQTLLLHVQQTLNATRPIGDLSQTELDALKSGVTTVQGYIDTSASTLTNSVQAIAAARTSLTSYQIAYDKALSDLDVDVASLRADVARQSALLAAARDDLAKTELVALADGVVSTLDVKVGENVVANQDVLGIISDGFSIKVDISEADISKVSVEDTVRITLDAYGDDVFFEGSVVDIEPAQTEISGVVYYNITILFDGEADAYEIRSGMTANVDILTDRKENVLVVPRRAVLTQDGKKIVRVVTDTEKGIFEERDVETGLSGDDGLVEIVSGVEEGEEIVTFLKEV